MNTGFIRESMIAATMAIGCNYDGGAIPQDGGSSPFNLVTYQVPTPSSTDRRDIVVEQQAQAVLVQQVRGATYISKYPAVNISCPEGWIAQDPSCDLTPPVVSVVPSFCYPDHIPPALASAGLMCAPSHDDAGISEIHGGVYCYQPTNGVRTGILTLRVTCHRP